MAYRGEDEDMTLLDRLKKKREALDAESAGDVSSGAEKLAEVGIDESLKAVAAKKAAKLAAKKTAETATKKAAETAVKDTAKEAAGGAIGGVAGGLGLATSGAGKELLSGKKLTAGGGIDTLSSGLMAFGGPAGMAAGAALALGKGLFGKKKAKKAAAKLKAKAADIRGKKISAMKAQEQEQKDALKSAERKKLLEDLK